MTRASFTAVRRNVVLAASLMILPVVSNGARSFGAGSQAERLSTVRDIWGRPHPFGPCGPWNDHLGSSGIRGLMTADAAGNVYFTERSATVVWKMKPDGSVAVVAGNGRQGYGNDGSAATAVPLGAISGLAADAAGNLYIADSDYPRIRKVTLAATITTVAGSRAIGFSGDGGPALSAAMCPPTGIAVDGLGNLFVASGPGVPVWSDSGPEDGDYRVRRIDTSGVITTVAGMGGHPMETGYPEQQPNGRQTIRMVRRPPEGGPATSGPIYARNITADAEGNLFVSDGDGISRITPNGTIATYAGKPPGISDMTTPAFITASLAADARGNLFFGEWRDHSVGKIDRNAAITKLAGPRPGDAADSNAPLPPARNAGPVVAADGAGNLFILEIAEESESLIRRRIRRVSPDGRVSTILDRATPPAPRVGSLTISGRIVGPVPTDPVITMRLVRRDNNGNLAGNVYVRTYASPMEIDSVRQISPWLMAPSPETPDERSFEIVGLAPGTYELFVGLSANDGSIARVGVRNVELNNPVGFGRTSIELREDVKGLTVTAHPLVDLKGRVTLDGRPGAPGGLEIRLQPDASATSDIPLYQWISRYRPAIAADGSFTIPAVPMANYRVSATVPGNMTASITDIRVGGASIRNADIAIGNTPPGVIEIVTRSAGQAAPPSVPPVTIQGGREVRPVR